MDKTKKILVINGSYRDDGITDQAIEFAVQALIEMGVSVETILLREYPIQFCLNCRECTQAPGSAPGRCIQSDGMQALVDRIEQSDAFILAAPTNFGSVTAIFKRFMERLIVYAYWPWDNHYPQSRKAKQPKKKALLISSSAAPGFFGRWLYGSSKQLKMVAETIGAESVGTLFTGMISQTSNQRLPESTKGKARNMAAKLLQS
jgi:multimeric flavodoxin WrbA